MARISVQERNNHYFDVEEEYLLRVTGVMTMRVDRDLLEEELTNAELDHIILASDGDIELQAIAFA